MAVRIIETRYCDMCEADFTHRPDWMILSAPNAPEDTDAQFDFCSYNCLVAWINTPDEDETAESLGAALEQGTPVQIASVPQDVQPPRPMMTLADAIATGSLSPRRV